MTILTRHLRIADADTNKNIRKWLHEKYAGKCFYCGCATILLSQQEAELHGLQSKLATIEHLKPLGEGGTNDLENLVLACFECNQSQARKQNYKQQQQKPTEQPRRKERRAKPVWKRGRVKWVKPRD